MKNLGQMMKQAQEMQAKMAEMQEQLSATEVTGSAGGGMVRVTMTGKNEARKLKIDAALINPAEAEVLEDLIVAAHGNARAKVDARMREETSKMMGGVELPAGFKLPF